MSIIVPSSHTRIGAWVNSKNVGEESTIGSILHKHSIIGMTGQYQFTSRHAYRKL